MKLKLGTLLSSMFLLASGQAFASAYNVPPENESLIGQIQYTSASSGDSVVTVAQRYNLGYNALQDANPQLSMNRAFTYGAPLQLPTQHLLPNQPRKGIVINLPEMRMYYYVPNSHQVWTFPIGIGKVGKTIPIQNTYISRKKEDPTWIPPDDIREFNLQQGIVLPRVMPPGPDNPLGHYAIYTGIPTYLIHSTIFPESVGRRASFGCIRMYQSDIESFFPTIQSGTPVAIINSPTKVGWQDDKLYMEVHAPLEEHSYSPDASLPGMVHLINSASNNQPVFVDWQLVSYLAQEKDGLPHDIGIKLPQQ